MANPFIPKETAEEKAKRVNVENIRDLQKLDKAAFNNPLTPSDESNDMINTTTDLEKVPPPTNQQKLVAHKDLTSELDRKNAEAKLNKAMLYQDRYHVASSAMEASGKAAVVATVAKVAIGALAASGVGVPAAAGIAVCLILVSKLMKKYKEMQELNILLLDMNTILTNCYYLENMINKVLTVFQIYINDFTEDKKYYRKIITVDEYYTDLNNARSCKNIAILVEENTDKNNGSKPLEENTDKNETKVVEEKTPTKFLERTKALKGYNLGERIQNAKQLYIESRDIDAVIHAEKAEYDAFGTVINVPENYVNIDDEDAMESLLKFVVYKRIEEGFKSCKNVGEDAAGEVTTNIISENNVLEEQEQKGGDKFYDAESKIIYKIGVNPDIKFRIKQKLDIIRDLLIEIDPSSAQDSMNSVELNESIDKIETKAFEKLENKKQANQWITFSIPSMFKFYSSSSLKYELPKDNDKIKSESELDALLGKSDKYVTDVNKATTLNQILTYWFGIKQKKYDENFLKAHKEEWTNFLKTCFLKMAFYKSGKKVQDKPYANYEDWVRAFLKVETEKSKSSVLSWFSQKGTDVKKFLGAKNKTTLLMNTLNTLNALFIIINSQFEMSLKYYERALKFDYTSSSASDFSSVGSILDLIGFNSRSDKKNVKGIDRIWELCESSVSYQKFLLPPDFTEDKKAIMDQVDVADFTKKSEGTPGNIESEPV